MGIFSNIFKKKKEDIEFNKKNQIVAEVQNNDDEITAIIAAVVASMDEEEEIIAAITAAIACMLGKSTSNFIVKNIKRTSEIDSLWALKGRMKLMS